MSRQKNTPHAPATEERARYQTWRHATTFSNYVTIAVDGIQVGAAPPQAGRKAIWLHRPEKTPWAILHTMQRHEVGLEDIVVLELHLRREDVKRHGNGLWYTYDDISPSAIRAVLSGSAIARQTPIAPSCSGGA